MANKSKETNDANSKEKRCGLIALLGLSNSGKSTLVNQLVGEKVAITSHKIQTTRVAIRGITTIGESQLVLVDTPGIFDPKRKLDRFLVEAAWNASYDADIILVLIDASKKIDDTLENLLIKIEQRKSITILVLNKIDRIIKKENLLPIVSKLKDKFSFNEIFMISALHGNGIDELRKYLSLNVPVGPWLYPPEDISDAPLRVLAAEITREKIYQYLHEEVPYSSSVVTESWKNIKKDSLRIEQTIYVEKESQKKIMIGKSGQTIKNISSSARAELSKILEKKVDLFLFVKVRENWTSKPDIFREIGLEISKNK